MANVAFMQGQLDNVSSPGVLFLFPCKSLITQHEVLSKILEVQCDLLYPESCEAGISCSTAK